MQWVWCIRFEIGQIIIFFTNNSYKYWIKNWRTLNKFANISKIGCSQTICMIKWCTCNDTISIFKEMLQKPLVQLVLFRFNRLIPWRSCYSQLSILYKSITFSCFLFFYSHFFPILEWLSCICVQSFRGISIFFFLLDYFCVKLPLARFSFFV